MKQSILKIAILLFAYTANAQDINFSQFYEMPALRNPALSGIFKGDIRITSIYRSQWRQLLGQNSTTGVGLETKSGINEFTDNFYSLGLVVTNDVAGDAKLGKTQVLPSFAFHKSLSQDRNLFLSAGFMGGIVQQRFDASKLKFDDQFVNGSYSQTNATRQTFTNTNTIYWDMTAGLAISGDLGYKYKFYLGAAYSHFNQPKVAFDRNVDVRLNKKIAVNGGLSANVTDYDQLYIYADYFQQGGNTVAQGGMLYKHNLMQQIEEPNYSISVGVFHRLNDAVIPVVKLDYLKVSVGVTYDINISKLSTAAQLRGGAEVTLSYKTFLNTRNSSLDKVRCPVL
ncbi:MAG: PorP/SprF family type IX secretion system membrane protein [Bacteroidota bacterium]